MDIFSKALRPPRRFGAEWDGEAMRMVAVRMQGSTPHVVEECCGSIAQVAAWAENRGLAELGYHLADAQTPVAMSIPEADVAEGLDSPEAKTLAENIHCQSFALEGTSTEIRYRDDCIEAVLAKKPEDLATIMGLHSSAQAMALLAKIPANNAAIIRVFQKTTIALFYLDGFFHSVYQIPLGALHANEGQFKMALRNLLCIHWRMRVSLEPCQSLFAWDEESREMVLNCELGWAPELVPLHDEYAAYSRSTVVAALVAAGHPELVSLGDARGARHWRHGEWMGRNGMLARVAAVLAIVVLLVVLVGHAVSWSVKHYYDKEWTQFQQMAITAGKLDSLGKELETGQEQLKNLLVHKSRTASLVQDIRRCWVAGVVLLSWDLREDGTSSLDGQADSQASLSLLLETLNKSKTLGGARLRSSARIGKANSEQIRFSIELGGGA